MGVYQIDVQYFWQYNFKHQNQASCTSLILANAWIYRILPISAGRYDIERGCLYYDLIWRLIICDLTMYLC